MWTDREPVLAADQGLSFSFLLFITLRLKGNDKGPKLITVRQTMGEENLDFSLARSVRFHLNKRMKMSVNQRVVSDLL